MVSFSFLHQLPPTPYSHLPHCKLSRKVIKRHSPCIHPSANISPLQAISRPPRKPPSHLSNTKTLEKHAEQEKNVRFPSPSHAPRSLRPRSARPIPRLCHARCGQGVASPRRDSRCRGAEPQGGAAPEAEGGQGPLGGGACE
ncbi:hypothetical protein PMIN01_00033 [Paraphaeosphaeria minitans]|uniref:Uncharacterized protein n=1 Tax=Paraphaeosphaeria minitans TaxID=565426 RepID=A0A9P6GUL5_9PLEO|nr:hypothetical protein PMIN01_00033 [Paraphaeosphaeria minitans]